MTVAALAVLVLAASGCATVQDAGPPTSRQSDIAGVHAVELQTSGDLTIRIGDAESLTINAGANAIDNLTADVVDGTLVLGSKPSLSVSGPISYALTVHRLDRIELDGSGGVTGAGVLSGDATVRISGSGSATLTDLELTDLTADLSGSGAARLTGSGQTSTIEVSGSGDYDGSGLTTTRTQVDVRGSGHARVNVTGQLTATVSGSGGVTYTGNPASVQRDVTGSGEIVAG